MHVVAADIELAAMEAVAHEIGGTEVQLDVGKPDQLQALADPAFRDHRASICCATTQASDNRVLIPMVRKRFDAILAAMP